MGSCENINKKLNKMNDFLKQILALGAEIEKADSAVEIDMAINDAEIAYEKHLDQLAISRVVGQSGDCENYAEWDNGIRWCSVCGTKLS